MQRTGWLMVAALSLGACASDEEWAGGPNSFDVEGAQWQIVKQGTNIAGQWVNPPAGVSEPEVRYQAIRAFTAYAGCDPAPASMQINGTTADALMRC